VSSAQLCGSLCPASQTQVFYGSEIVRAVASNGTRYSALDNALVYRKRIVPGCTCNGKDPFGLARLDAATDPTLKSGDVVSSPGGQAAAPEAKPKQ